ncbi:UNVERIFIED_CONTAM: hypothetical protein FKN15_003764 [Acipenser sinensis]
MLAELVEDFKKTRLNPPAAAAQSCAGPGDVLCDFCTGRKFKAVNSCLTCLVSYCETHIKPHLEAAALKRHKLIEATGNLEQKICAEHQKVLEVFCRTDQTCICVLCTQDEHKNHDTVSAKKERTGRQEELRETQTELELRIQERLRELEELKQAVESLKVGIDKRRSSQREIQESEKIFTQLIRSIEKIRSEVTELIGAQEKATVNQAEGIMKKLEQEIAELRRRNAELKQLSETKDHIHFLQNFQSLCVPPEAAVFPSVTVNPDVSFEAVRKAVSQLQHHIEDFCKGECPESLTALESEEVLQEEMCSSPTVWAGESNGVPIVGSSKASVALTWALAKGDWELVKKIQNDILMQATGMVTPIGMESSSAAASSAASQSAVRTRWDLLRLDIQGRRVQRDQERMKQKVQQSALVPTTGSAVGLRTSQGSRNGWFCYRPNWTPF